MAHRAYRMRFYCLGVQHHRRFRRVPRELARTGEAAVYVRDSAARLHDDRDDHGACYCSRSRGDRRPQGLRGAAASHEHIRRGPVRPYPLSRPVHSDPLCAQRPATYRWRGRAILGRRRHEREWNRSARDDRLCTRRERQRAHDVERSRPPLLRRQGNRIDERIVRAG